MHEPLCPGLLILLSILTVLAIWGAVLYLGADKVGQEVQEANGPTTWRRPRSPDPPAGGGVLARSGHGHGHAGRGGRLGRA